MKIVGCSVFRVELEHVLGETAEVDWLPAGLHVSEGRLAEAIDAALQGTSGAACVYGACFPDIDQVLDAHGARRLPARNCVEAFLSPEERAAFGDAPTSSPPATCASGAASSWTASAGTRSTGASTSACTT